MRLGSVGQHRDASRALSIAIEKSRHSSDVKARLPRGESDRKFCSGTEIIWRLQFQSGISRLLVGRSDVNYRTFPWIFQGTVERRKLKDRSIRALSTAGERFRESISMSRWIARSARKRRIIPATIHALLERIVNYSRLTAARRLPSAKLPRRRRLISAPCQLTRVSSGARKK